MEEKGVTPFRENKLIELTYSTEMQHQHEFIPNAALQQQQILCPPESTLWMGDLKPEWDAHFIREAFGENAGDVTNVKMVSTGWGWAGSHFYHLHFFCCPTLYVKLKMNF